MWQLPKLTPEEILYYLRKSQSDDPLLSVEETLSKHEQMLDEWVERNLPGMGRVEEQNRMREVVSGETIDSRPRFLQLLRLIESPKIKAVLCVEPERLSRGSLKEIGRIVELFRYSNTIIITRQYTYDLRDDRDRELFERALMRGNDYLEYYKRIQQNGRLLAVQNGNFIGQKAPYGFNKIKLKEGKKDCHTLEPNPDTAPVVKMIFEWYAQGIGTTTIADRLNAMHIPAPEGGEWVTASIPPMLRNHHYIGMVRWNHRPTTKTIEDGQVVVSRPRAEDFLVYEGKHPAIISMELWDAVQEIRGKIPRNKKNTAGFNPLAGIMFCECGRAMSGRTFTRKGVEYCAPRFLCSQQRKCGNASATMSSVLEELAQVLRDAIADFEIKIDSGADNSAELHRQMVERLEKRLRELQELEIAQWDAKTKGGMPAHVFDRLNGQTLAEIEEVQQALCTARDSMPQPVNLQEKRATFQAALDALQDPELPAKEKNKLLKKCVERITYSRKRTGNNGHPVKGEETPIHLDIQLRV
jgi:DNA invertase Pin-like site-specific DNA recombinase